MDDEASAGNGTLPRLLPCCFLSVEDAHTELRVQRPNILGGKIAQPAHRVKDKRLRRAFGILDTARWLCSGMVKGLLPTPVEQG